MENIFSALLLSGPEVGIDIDIDDINISIPPATRNPNPNDVCGNIVLNGDAESPHGFVAPFYSFIRSKKNQY